MKFFLAVLAVIGLSSPALGATECKVDDSIGNGYSNVTYTFTPTAMDLVRQFGLDNNKSPQALFNLLTGPLNPTAVFAKALNSALLTACNLNNMTPFTPKIVCPSCEFLWATNKLACTNLHSTIVKSSCAMAEGITKVEKAMKIPLPLPQTPDRALPCEGEKRWGLKTVRAEEAWAAGFNGAGVIVANIDTGVRHTHEELRDNYRSEYGFYNAITPTNTVPMDDHGHGTHTMGSICGKTVGVAPGAKWIACRACDNSGCDDTHLTKCGQWLLCPDKNAKNCTTKPHIINNSWGGGIGNVMYNPVLALLKAAGIINFFATGNDGPTCFSVKSPADSNQTDTGIISVGSTACNEAISSFSSVGPSQAADYLLGLAVSVVSPGSNIFSAWKDNDTSTNIVSGTSQACPHAAGVGAVLLSKNPNLNVEQMRAVLQRGAFRNAEVTQATCGGNDTTNGGAWPNNVYGYGRVDVAASMALL